ncbi:MAG TPA: tRNA lysidine(34) synthetase TilS [Clostridia bacterium]|nr:tRNA lysidine(34) synthetase TilS [Clostridia bacterium]
MYHKRVLTKLLAYVRELYLVRPGDRVGVAVSGGADSVALLRALLELRTEFGAVLSVVHLHHGIRGAQADADAQFVCDLALEHELECHQQSVDVPAYAGEHAMGVEAAGRKLRYQFFESLIRRNLLDKVATAHTADDQAETVLLRTMRGAGSRGLAGIYPRLSLGEREESGVVRPLLSISRNEVEQYLESIGQRWCEDATNRDRRYLRNRVRHELLPLLERDYNPSIRRVLSESAEIARAEEDFWDAEVRSLSVDVITSGESRAAVGISALAHHPLALRRRLIRFAAEQAGLALDFHHIEELLSVAERTTSRCVLPNGYFAERRGGELVIKPRVPTVVVEDYEYHLGVPGEVVVREAGLRLRTRLVTVTGSCEGYNPAALLNPGSLASVLVVRNWKAGDRFHPVRSRSPEKLKRLLQEKKVLKPDKALWPVVVSGDSIVWVRGFPVAVQHAFRQQTGQAVLIEELSE